MVNCLPNDTRGESEAKLTGGKPAKHTLYAGHCEERSDVAISSKFREYRNFEVSQLIPTTSYRTTTDKC